MVTKKNEIMLKIDGKVLKINSNKINKIFPKNDDLLYSGSIVHEDDNSSYFFDRVNKSQLKHIIDQVRDDIGLNEVKIEIQTYDGDAKSVQQKGTKKYFI